MTGFGVGEAPTPIGRLVVEVRAVNHRFLDVRVRAPRELGDLVAYAEQLGRERLTRGRIEVGIRVESAGGRAVALDVERARTAYQALCKLRDELSPSSEVPLSLLAAVPDLFAPATERERETLRAACKTAFERAAVALEGMRAEEGRALSEDLRVRLAAVRRAADGIAARAPQLVDLYQKRLKQRLSRLVGSDVPVDPGRLEPCGRRLDFLLQEMVREVNTIGSKAQDAEVAHLVVEAKSELERMREQVQNVE
jgi:uncharacterized protein (TIGR00255 family)